MKSLHLDEILTLDPERDHQRIVYLLACYEYPWDMTRALELALFRTYCVPSISGLLDRTGEFAARPQKRYDDTDLIINILMEEGYDSPAGQAALARMNAIHGRFPITNEDYLYVLSTFVFVPLTWFQRFGRRPPTSTSTWLFSTSGAKLAVAWVSATSRSVTRPSPPITGTTKRPTTATRKATVASARPLVSYSPPGSPAP